MTTPPPPFDPELAAALGEVGGQAPTTAVPDGIPAAREQLNDLLALMTTEWPGGYHGFDGLVPRAALSVDARAARLRWLRRLLDQ